VNPRTTLRAGQENFGGTEASLDGGDQFLREGIERWGAWLLGAHAQGLGRHETARLVWRGVAAKQAGVGDVLDVPQPGTQRGGVVTGLADGGADRDAYRAPTSARSGEVPFVCPSGPAPFTTGTGSSGRLRSALSGTGPVLTFATSPHLGQASAPLSNEKQYPQKHATSAIIDLPSLSPLPCGLAGR
jgi:hypothetical protein